MSDAMRAAGLRCDVVTGGGSGTYALEAASGVFTEVQPGGAWNQTPCLLVGQKLLGGWTLGDMQACKGNAEHIYAAEAASGVFAEVQPGVPYNPSPCMFVGQSLCGGWLLRCVQGAKRMHKQVSAAEAAC